MFDAMLTGIRVEVFYRKFCLKLSYQHYLLRCTILMNLVRCYDDSAPRSSVHYDGSFVMLCLLQSMLMCALQWILCDAMLTAIPADVCVIMDPV